jgi:hypothetical protein
MFTVRAGTFLLLFLSSENILSMDSPDSLTFFPPSPEKMEKSSLNFQSDQISSLQFVAETYEKELHSWDEPFQSRKVKFTEVKALNNKDETVGKLNWPILPRICWLDRSVELDEKVVTPDQTKAVFVALLKHLLEQPVQDEFSELIRVEVPQDCFEFAKDSLVMAQAGINPPDSFVERNYYHHCLNVLKAGQVTQENHKKLVLFIAARP